jgi:hypothetical protein
VTNLASPSSSRLSRTLQARRLGRKELLALTAPENTEQIVAFTRDDANEERDNDVSPNRRRGNMRNGNPERFNNPYTEKNVPVAPPVTPVNDRRMSYPFDLSGFPNDTRPGVSQKTIGGRLGQQFALQCPVAWVHTPFGSRIRPTWPERKAVRASASAASSASSRDTSAREHAPEYVKEEQKQEEEQKAKAHGEGRISVASPSHTCST